MKKLLIALIAVAFMATSAIAVDVTVNVKPRHMVQICKNNMSKPNCKAYVEKRIKSYIRSMVKYQDEQDDIATRGDRIPNDLND